MLRLHSVTHHSRLLIVKDSEASTEARGIFPHDALMRLHSALMPSRSGLPTYTIQGEDEAQIILERGSRPVPTTLTLLAAGQRVSVRLRSEARRRFLLGIEASLRGFASEYTGFDGQEHQWPPRQTSTPKHPRGLDYADGHLQLTAQGAKHTVEIAGYAIPRLLRVLRGEEDRPWNGRTYLRGALIEHLPGGELLIGDSDGTVRRRLTPANRAWLAERIQATPGEEGKLHIEQARQREQDAADRERALASIPRVGEAYQEFGFVTPDGVFTPMSASEAAKARLATTGPGHLVKRTVVRSDWRVLDTFRQGDPGAPWEA